jgi:hypothetical protein
VQHNVTPMVELCKLKHPLVTLPPGVTTPEQVAALCNK